jgi:putative serine protease PepD
MTQVSARTALLVAVVSAALAVAALVLAARGGGSTTSTTPSPATTAAPASETSRSVPTVNEIYRENAQGVVDIKVSTTTTGALGLSTQQTEAEGAGVVFDRYGDILTDEHVIAGASSATVTFADGTTARAKVVGTDPSTDVAVLRVAVSSTKLHPIAFASSSDVRVGDPVVAIGSPFSLPETVTSGIVSAVGRSMSAPNGYTIVGAIQTDAPINPGDSGGPVLDGRGDVLGLADQIATGTVPPGGEGQSAGVGFATPSNLVVRVAGRIIAGKPVVHAYAGVLLGSASTGRATIVAVQPNSPASKAGLEQGDVITAVDGKAVRSTEQFIEIVEGHNPGQTLTLDLKRGATTLTVGLTLAVRPKT